MKIELNHFRQFSFESKIELNHFQQFSFESIIELNHFQAKFNILQCTYSAPSHGRYNLTIQSMIEFPSKMIQFNFWFKRKLSKMIQFNFQFKRRLSGFNSQKIFNKKEKNRILFETNIQFKIILGQFNSIIYSIQNYSWPIQFNEISN